MKGDFTRNTFDPRKHFTRVLMQQGRVQLDADWNEQVAIVLHYLQALAEDLIGPHAGPADRCGFGLIVEQEQIGMLKDADGNPLSEEETERLRDALQKYNLLVGIGRYYVHGLLCENDSYFGFGEQAGYPFAQSISIEEIKKSKDSFLVFLDAWERHITWIEDDSIREKALNGPDTTTRAQATWQVRVPRLSEEEQKQLQKLGNEVRRGGETARGAAASQKLIEFAEQVAISLRALSSGLMRARVDPDQPYDDPCVLAPNAGYRGTANQLYRVEVHTGGTAKEATFKWSRDNGSVATAWLGSEGNDLVVRSTRGFSAGQWVELTDDLRELRGESGVLVKLAKVEGEALTIDPASTKQPVAWSQAERNPKVRRWDHRETPGTKLVGGAIPITESEGEEGWISLEDGIQVQFLPLEANPPRQYRTGDYWLIPARIATGTIEWPGVPQDPQGLSAHGVDHRYAPLAMIAFAADGSINVTELRSRFQRLE